MLIIILITSTGFLDQYETYDIGEYTSHVELFVNTGWKRREVIRTDMGTISILYKHSVKDN